MVYLQSVKLYMGGNMSEDRFKANMKYLGLAFSYFVIFILRLINWMPYNEGTEIIKIKTLSIKLSILSVIYIVLRMFDSSDNNMFEMISIAVSITGLSAVIFVGVVFASIFAFHLEKSLSIRADNEFKACEERMGNRKGSYFCRKLCVAMQNLCNNFLSIGWMCVLPMVVIGVIYYQFFDRGSSSESVNMHTYVLGVILATSFGWKEAASIYWYRKKREQYYQYNYQYKTTSDGTGHSGQYNTTNNEYEEDEPEDEEYQDPIMAGYFSGCMSMSDLKKTYRKLVKRMHPDVGGDVDDFQRMNNEYEYCLKKWGKKGR